MFTGIVLKGFTYVKVYPVLEIKLGLAPANGMTHHKVNAGDVMEFEDQTAFEMMEAVATEGGGMLARQYRLGSNEMVNTPGILRWAQAHIKTDGLAVKRVIYAWAPTPGMSAEEKAARPSKRLLESLVNGKVKHTIDGDTVVFPVL